MQDVKAELAIYRRLSRFPMLQQEWRHYHTDQRINDRGVKIDTRLVQQAIACDLMLSDGMAKKAYELTGLENPNSVSQLKTWLEERGIPMESLGKKDVAAMIEELDKNGIDEEALSMLKLWLQMAKSSGEEIPCGRTLRLQVTAGQEGCSSFTGRRGRDGMRAAIYSSKICPRTISPHWKKRGNW